MLEQTRNAMLFKIKQNWLEGMPSEHQRTERLIVADWLEEKGYPEEAAILRTDNWAIFYQPRTDAYFVACRNKTVFGAVAYPVFWNLAALQPLAEDRIDPPSPGE